MADNPEELTQAISRASKACHVAPQIPHLTPRIPHILQAMSRFKDSLTLDALHRPQLMAFCQARHGPWN